MPWAVAAAVVGGVIASDASRKASNAQSDAARRASEEGRQATDASIEESRRATDLSLAEQRAAREAALGEARRQYELTRSDAEPYRQTGYAALSQLGGLANYDPTPDAASVMAEPGYQFGRTQGLNAIQGTAAANGSLYSGQALKELTQFGNDYATTRYGDAWNRAQANFGNRWGRLSALAGIGQTANQQVGAAGQAYANRTGQIVTGNANAVGNLLTGNAQAVGGLMTGNAANQGNLMMGNANAQGAAGLQRASIWGNGINQLAGLAQYRSNQNRGYQAPAWSGRTWQNQGGPMDTGGYGDYGNLGGP